jgi:hypothetical protein
MKYLVKTFLIIVIAGILVGCRYKLFSTANHPKSNDGLFSNISIPEDTLQREFLYFDGKGLVYYMTDTCYFVEKQKQRIIKYAAKSDVSIMNDSIFFKLDSFYIGKGTFSVTIFNGKKIYGEEKVYYHELMQKYSGISHNDTLKLNRLSVSMRKDSSYQEVTFVKYIGN